MNEQEQAMADEIYAAIQHASHYSDRSLQAKEFRLGISSFGFCPERNRRELDQQEAVETDVLSAFIGTAVGDHAERALAKVWPDAIIQSEVFLDLQLATRSIRLPGHPDVVRPGLVLDGKTDFGLSTIEREGPSFAHLWQRNAYALATWQMGMHGDMPLDEVMTGNFWIDRGAVDKRVHVDLAPFDQEIIDRGVEEIDSIIYAYENGEEAEKRPPRQMCKVVCGFYEKCRGWETDVSGLIEDEGLVMQIESYVAGRDLVRQGGRMQAEAKAHLQDISGSTGRHMLRWTWVNPNEDRAGYYKIDVSTVKGVDA
jgi:hypothetical protein